MVKFERPIYGAKSSTLNWGGFDVGPLNWDLIKDDLNQSEITKYVSDMGSEIEWGCQKGSFTGRSNNLTEKDPLPYGQGYNADFSGYIRE